MASEKDIRPFPYPLITQQSIDRALELVPKDKNGAVISFIVENENGEKKIEGAVAARIDNKWSFVTKAGINTEHRGENFIMGVVRFEW